MVNGARKLLEDPFGSPEELVETWKLTSSADEEAPRVRAAVMLHFLAERFETAPGRKLWMSRRLEKRLLPNLSTELSLEDPNLFRRYDLQVESMIPLLKNIKFIKINFKYMRMDTSTFEDLVWKIGPLIRNQDAHFRASIPPAEKLSLTLRHLATGESLDSLAKVFRLGQSSINVIIKEVCRGIVAVLQSEYLQYPKSATEWKMIAEEFGEMWNFENCIGAIDGKHVRIEPVTACSQYRNTDSMSIVLVAVVDAYFRFIYIDFGTNVRSSDGDVWNKCALKSRLEANDLKIPRPSSLSGTRDCFPYVLAGDKAFSLSNKLLIPYSGPECARRRDRRIFNYRLSRARRCSENAFGVMGARFQIYRSALKHDADDAKDIVMATCVLHNMLRSKTVDRSIYTPPSFIDEEDTMSGVIRQGAFRAEGARALVNIVNKGVNPPEHAASHLRDRWCQYFNSPHGAVRWQDRMTR